MMLVRSLKLVGLSAVIPFFTRFTCFGNPWYDCKNENKCVLKSGNVTLSLPLYPIGSLPMLVLDSEFCFNDFFSFSVLAFQYCLFLIIKTILL